MKTSRMTSALISGWLLIEIAFLAIPVCSQTPKQLYIPRSITRTGMDMNDTASQWSHAHSRRSDNWVVFWERGFGPDPALAPAPYTVNVDRLLEVAERSFEILIDSLGFVTRGSSAVDNTLQIIFLLYTADWSASGAGQDDRVGTMGLSPSAANRDLVVAHEAGHVFQYLTGVDQPGAGFRWGLGPNGDGGNGFWEQGANWKTARIYPDQFFGLGSTAEYMRSNHLHILHERPRYANYFLPEYWEFRRGNFFNARLWRETRRPEDPIETYRRLTGIGQEEFNDEMWDHAARLTTWDLPRLRALGANQLDRRAQPRLNRMPDGFWRIDSSVAPENHGYNSVRLNVAAGRTVSAQFRGLAGAPGYRSVQTEQAGWRHGFVALRPDGTRVYGTMAAARWENGANPVESVSFTVPADAQRLWYVVSGAPQSHWRHPWDDNSANDEQWPWEVAFSNTNLLGQPDPAPSSLDLGPAVERDRIIIRDGVLTLGSTTTRAEILDARGVVQRVLTVGDGSLDLRDLPVGMLLVRVHAAHGGRPEVHRLLHPLLTGR